ncbi:unnamed protein product (macronuclear) [Paramecium tetraurelia]|uniref:DUF4201 domain-containing protein n=1 Tax=Paramecium tetraurelia TaxID=5888 RepID=A0DP03_PARTE|nr:uncharacterized protein GSPATT00018966001 [Paramecium tetraurelia]CAK84770.1 unnamed protein product [Paramecium tetraurelia]|eukprot:XP_001452167.1 hypothetical protein (macronuclear) [Paramecium tetraurelia strain d4-2]
MLLISDDPLALTQPRLEQMELKLTFDVQFLLSIDLNFNSPKIQQAMLNLNMREEELVQKKYQTFQLPEEEDFITEQRFLFHLHQIAHRRKFLIKERNKIKKEELESQKLDQQMTRYYTQTDSLLNLNIENAISQLDKKIELQQLKRDRNEVMMKNKIKELVEEELKQINEQKQKEEEKRRIEKLKQKTLKTVSDRAHSFNKKTELIAKKHQELILEQQEKAFQKQREILEREMLESEDFPRGLSQSKIKQKEKEYKDGVKQKQVNDRIKQLKQQELEQCNQLYKKIEQKLNKSHANRIGQYDNQKTCILLNQSQSKIEDTQKYLEKYIEKQNRFLKNSKNQNSQTSLTQTSNIKKRMNIRQSIERERQEHCSSLEENIQDKKLTRLLQPQLNKNTKSRSLVNLEKAKFQQIEKVKKVLEKQRSGSVVQIQIKEKKEILRDVSRSIFLKKSLYQELQNDITKIKQNVSKDFLVKQIQKLDCSELVQKYIK